MTKNRIYICGSHSVGKTTLCRELGKHLGYRVVPEAARDIMANNKIDLRAISKDVEAKNMLQGWIGDDHLTRHANAIRDLEDGNFTQDDPESKGIIFDRGIDFLVYASEYSTLAHKQWASPNTQEYIECLKHPNALVLLLQPHESALVADGVRASLDLLTAHKITFGIKCLLEVFGVSYIDITAPEVLERVKLVKSIIGV